MHQFSRKISILIGFVVCITYFFVYKGPWEIVQKSRGARDFASYYYAFQVAIAGDDPYNTKNLKKQANQERTRKRVHPFFYPPPALLSMFWVKPLSLKASYQVFFWLNQLLFFLTLNNIRRWLNLSLLPLAVLALSFTPVADSMKMGQANNFILWLLSVALYRSSGWALGIAAMTKMSPALLFFQWLFQNKPNDVRNCLASVFILTISSLFLVTSSMQFDFYTIVLPQFFSGEYHGLRVPINLPANHSIPDLLNQLWPGDSQHQLSVIAKRISTGITLCCLSGILYLSKIWSLRKSQIYLQGAMICLMLLIPVYCYEHHLVLLILPITILYSGLLNEKFPKWSYWVAGFSYGFAAWPLFLLRMTQKKVPQLHWVIQESKFISIVIIAVMCVCAAYMHQRRDNALANCA